MSFALLSPSHALTAPRDTVSDAVSMPDTEPDRFNMMPDAEADECHMPDAEPDERHMPDAEPDERHMPDAEPDGCNMPDPDRCKDEKILLLFPDNIQMYVSENTTMELFPETAKLSDHQKELLSAGETVTITVGDATHVVRFVVNSAVIDNQPESLLSLLLHSPDSRTEDGTRQIRLTNEDPRLYPIVFKHLNNLFTGEVAYIRLEEESDTQEIQERICNFLQIDQMPVSHAVKLQRLILSVLTITDEDVGLQLQSAVYDAFLAKATALNDNDLVISKHALYKWLRAHGARNTKKRKQMHYKNVRLAE